MHHYIIIVNYGDVGTMFDTFFGQPESVTKDAIKSQPKESILPERTRFIMYYVSLVWLVKNYTSI